MHESSLEAFIVAVRAIPAAKDTKKASAVLRAKVTRKMEDAKTLSEKQEAYEYYKAFYELQPYASEEI